MLDAFPLNGGVSNLEALRMGVPVLAMQGHTIQGRLSEAFNRVLGIGDWVARDGDHFVELARQKCADLETLATLRGSLRARFDSSIIGNHALYVAEVEQAYRSIWRRWLESRTLS